MSVLGDWLVRQAPAWLDPARAEPPLTPAQRRALLAIVRCRTPALGGHVYRCTNCDETDYAYHSCHHRSCPRCGGARTAEWTQKQTARLLPVPYFLVTFTVPEAMRAIFVARPAVLCDLFFAQAARALQTVAAVPRHLGAELGMIGVWHSWGRQVQYHPHLHFIIAGGGLTADQTAWRPPRRSDWLLPSKAVEAALRQGVSEALRHTAPDLHAQVPDACWREGWWVHWQPAGSGDNVVKYLARYVSRTAMSDERIIAATDETVRFRYTDSATHARKECTLTRGRVHAALSATRAAAGSASRALFRLDASGGQNTPDDRRDPAGRSDHRADGDGRTVVAPALSALRRLHAGLRGEDSPQPAHLRPVNVQRIESALSSSRCNGAAGRSLACVTQNVIQQASWRTRSPGWCSFSEAEQTKEPRGLPRALQPTNTFTSPAPIQSA
jgi:hypothetical protein